MAPSSGGVKLFHSVSGISHIPAWFDTTRGSQSLHIGSDEIILSIRTEMKARLSVPGLDPFRLLRMLRARREWQKLIRGDKRVLVSVNLVAPIFYHKQSRQIRRDKNSPHVWQLCHNF